MRQVNPGAFAIVLFPFSFAIMFGDVGHGAVLLLLALYFIANEERLLAAKLDDMVGMAFGGRYVLLLNALFAIYVGFLYNEAFSLPLGLFGSSYHLEAPEPPAPDTNRTHAVSAAAPTLTWDGRVYPFGVDPMWHRAANRMSFFNSYRRRALLLSVCVARRGGRMTAGTSHRYKMKISIIFGVAQMTLGIVLSLFNHLRAKEMRSVWFGFVPEMLFFLGVFG